MRAVDIIAKKRDGHTLSADEINFFIQGFVRGDIPDYQASAWAMAVVLQGMDEAETTALTLAMAHSGTVLDLSGVAPLVVDKHSSGGVGDKTTLIVAPIVAACGLYLGKMSGRGLAFSGGTLDKLESIPGFCADLSQTEFIAQLQKYHIVVSGPTHDLAPADAKLYALRDVTATVPALPLIASSIMSKKIAAGAHVIVLDVKVGQGAFMKTEAGAVALAELMVKIGRGAGRRVAAVISDMDQPLGRAVSNALEIVEALETLKGRGPADLVEHSLTVADQILLLAGAAPDEETARRLTTEALASGRALEKFRDLVQGQGGDPCVIEDYALLPRAAWAEDLSAPRAGFIAALDAEAIGWAAVLLGGGRAKKGDPLDHAVGIVCHLKVGERVERNQPVMTIYANDAERLALAEQQLVQAIQISDTVPAPPPLVHRIIG
jgi:pyrimidine-nucleoside phosphorylase